MIHGIDTGFLVAAEMVEHPEHAAARATLARLISASDFALFGEFACITPKTPAGNH
ncbi:MAG TPA: hypothetical protein PLF81_18860 [Candidatus Anammoximicrobium sp.]|nr:hypothetical protein [Candidatus Anammoximicrobium sp.]